MSSATPEQLGFDGFGAADAAPHRGAKRPAGPKGGKCRLFFAQMPTLAAAAEMSELCVSLKALHGLKGSMLAISRLHMTLDHLGDFVEFPQDIVTAACEAAATLATAPFEVSLGHVVSFGRHSERLPLVLKESMPANASLATFRNALWHALAHSGVPGPSRPAFTPHVTLLYDPQSIAEQPVTPIRWLATDFVLLRSFIGETRYQELGRWQL